jgi:hypothetical protein
VEGRLQEFSKNVRIVGFTVHPNGQSARIEVETVDQAKVAIGLLNGVFFHGSILRFQPCNPEYQPSLPNRQLHDSCNTNSISGVTKPSVDDISKSSDSVGGSDSCSTTLSTCSNGDSAVPMVPRTETWNFKVNREDHAVLVRRVPSSLTSEELIAFLKRRIQLAFKELTEDIKLTSYHVLQSSAQLCLEFEHKRHAEYALALRNKTIQGKTLDILRWDDRHVGMEYESTTISSHGGIDKNECDPKAVFVSKLPESISDDCLKTFLIDMMQVAYKVTPTILYCSVRPSPHNDAYVEFKTEQEVHRAVHLRNRTMKGQKVSIMPWDATFKLLNQRESKGACTQPPTRTEPLDREIQHTISNSFELQLPRNSIFNQDEVDREHEDPTQFPFNPIPNDDSGELLRLEPTNSDPDGALQHLAQLDEQPTRLSSVNQAGFNIFKRQLDALRLENQSYKQQLNDIALELAEIESLQSDRDKYRQAWEESQSSLQALTVGLASTRAECQRLETENKTFRTVSSDISSNCVTKLHENLLHDVPRGLNSKVDLESSLVPFCPANHLVNTHDTKSPSTLKIDPTQGSMDLCTALRIQIDDAERRFLRVTESLTRQTNMIHLTAVENIKLRARLDEERNQRRVLEQQLNERALENGDREVSNVD